METASVCIPSKTRLPGMQVSQSRLSAASSTAITGHAEKPGPASFAARAPARRRGDRGDDSGGIRARPLPQDRLSPARGGAADQGAVLRLPRPEEPAGRLDPQLAGADQRQVAG